jgi:hypothetical protein
MYRLKADIGGTQKYIKSWINGKHVTLSIGNAWKDKEDIQIQRFSFKWDKCLIKTVQTITNPLYTSTL